MYPWWGGQQTVGLPEACLLNQNDRYKSMSAGDGFNPKGHLFETSGLVIQWWENAHDRRWYLKGQP